MNFEFTTTATIRPEILDETYSSFKKGMVDIDLKGSTLYLNIDPIPANRNAEDVVSVAKKYFDNVIVNISNSPNFANAVKWCWSQPKNIFFFHLEDDWVLMQKISMGDLVKKLSSVIEHSRRFKIKNRMLDKFICVNLRAYDFINDGRVCLSPGVFLSSWAKKASEILKPEHNPERQMRQEFGVGNKFLIESRAIHHPRNRNMIIIKDIGRRWLEASEYAKDGGMSFTRWKNKLL